MVWLVVVSCSQVLIPLAGHSTACEGGGGQGMLWVSACQAGSEERASIRGGGRSCMNGNGEEEMVVWWLWKFAEWRSKIRRK